MQLFSKNGKSMKEDKPVSTTTTKTVYKINTDARDVWHPVKFPLCKEASDQWPVVLASKGLRSPFCVTNVIFLLAFFYYPFGIIKLFLYRRVSQSYTRVITWFVTQIFRNGSVVTTVKWFNINKTTITLFLCPIWKIKKPVGIISRIVIKP